MLRGFHVVCLSTYNGVPRERVPVGWATVSNFFHCLVVYNAITVNYKCSSQYVMSQHFHFSLMSCHVFKLWSAISESSCKWCSVVVRWWSMLVILHVLEWLTTERTGLCKSYACDEVRCWETVSDTQWCRQQIAKLYVKLNICCPYFNVYEKKIMQSINQTDIFCHHNSKAA